MSQYNTPPNLDDVIKDIKTRLATLEAARLDTGWQDLILPDGVTAGVVTPRARRIGDIVYFKGQGNTDATITAGSLIATLPSTVMYPATLSTSICWVQAQAAAMLVFTTGLIHLTVDWTSSFTCEFGGIFYGV